MSFSSQSLYNNRHETGKVDESFSMDLAPRGQSLRAGTQLFDRIPIELLQEIFLHCISRSPPAAAELLYHSIDSQGNSLRIAPLLLCQICKLWRQAAISFPDIWTSLDIFVSVGKARPSTPLATTWLARSGELPLSLSLHQQNGSVGDCIAAGQILELYERYTSRWCNIHFDLRQPRWPKYCRLLTSQQHSAPLLREFTIQMSYQIEVVDLFGIFDFVPRLSSLHVSQIPDLNLLGDCSVPIPWFQLGSLSLDYIPSVCASLHILEKCPNLMDVSFKVEPIVIYGSLPITPVYHKLHSLTINISHDQLSLFLGHVTFPELIQATIYVRGPLQNYGWPQAKLEAFLERSQCRLEHFEIHDTGMNCNEFIACVCDRHLQSLVKFIVGDRRDWSWNPFVTDHAVGLLTCSSLDNITVSGGGLAKISGSSACFLPNLESLVIQGTILCTAEGMVARMVESRWRYYCNGVKRLRRVELQVPSLHAEDVRRLKEFYSEGLELDMDL